MSWYHKNGDITFVDRWKKDNFDLEDDRKKCLHKTCPQCNGTGKTKRGEACVHMISCSCPKCLPSCL